MEQNVGEMDPDELAQCLLNPETRYIEQITVADIKQADTLLEILMGTSVPPRKEYILQHSEEANDVY